MLREWPNRLATFTLSLGLFCPKSHSNLCLLKIKGPKRSYKIQEIKIEVQCCENGQIDYPFLHNKQLREGSRPSREIADDLEHKQRNGYIMGKMRAHWPRKGKKGMVGSIKCHIKSKPKSMDTSATFCF